MPCFCFVFEWLFRKYKMAIDHLVHQSIYDPKCEVSGNKGEQNCKHVQTDACVRTLIKDNESRLKQFRLTY